MENTEEIAEKNSAGRCTRSDGQRWSGVPPRVRGDAPVRCDGGRHAQDLRCSHRPGVDWLDWGVCWDESVWLSSAAKTNRCQINCSPNRRLPSHILSSSSDPSLVSFPHTLCPPPPPYLAPRPPSAHKTPKHTPPASSSSSSPPTPPTDAREPASQRPRNRRTRPKRNPDPRACANFVRHLTPTWAMSRSSRAAASSSATITHPAHPTLDRDVVMGPPPIPPQIAPSPSAGARPKEGESQEVTEKYRRLKRKYFELEEVRRYHVRVSLPASSPFSTSSSLPHHRNTKTRPPSSKIRANAPCNGGANAGVPVPCL